MGCTTLRKHVDPWTIVRFFLSCSSQNSTEGHVISNWSKFWLKDRQLGHPSFALLKQIFLFLIKDVGVSSLHCNSCEFCQKLQGIVSNKK